MHPFRLAARAIGVAFVSLATPGAAHADPAYDTCMKTAMSNVDFDSCGGAYITRADAALNAAWKRVFAKVSGQSKTDLLAEQRSWIAFKEASCKFYANGDFGREGAVISYPACRAGVIEDRTKGLLAIGKSLERP
jgi:uncharacterized protein YecT (DUF1311 family)